MAWELGEGLGHVANLVPVARELLSRGHEVVCAARNVRTASVLANLGARVLQCPHQNWRFEPRFHPLVSYAHLLYSTGFNEADGLAALLNAWCDLIELVDPEVIVFEHSPSGLLASRDGNRKRVALGIGFQSPPVTVPLPSFRDDRALSGEQLMSDELWVLEQTNRALKRAGRRTLERLGDIFTGLDADLLLTYPELDHFGPRPHARYCGVHQEIPSRPVEWSPGDGPRLFAYLKWTRDLEGPLACLASRKINSIVYGPWVDDRQRKRFAGSAVRLVSHPVDVTTLACDVAVLNGTHGTTAQMLLAGIPVVQLPIFVEQAMTATNTVNLGAGLMVSPFTPDGFLRAIDEVAGDPRFSSAARDFSVRVRARTGLSPAEVAEEIIASAS